MVGYDNLEEFFSSIFLNSKLSDITLYKNIYPKFKTYYEKNFVTHEEIFNPIKKVCILLFSFYW